ncbi:serine/threonine-protein kinase WNK2-like [Melitaea cinxia]|uniref:serine/threonine-protein kinase WNK2-like n=1 Tax=Melitaea cinxia TaxID=113334 RepID=UPI001E273A74|nr:serine/threonine-protein kinase WNK2-like [Melitaea cinxia]
MQGTESRMQGYKITLLFCVCVWAVTADVAHIKATKAKLLGRLASKGRHHKRGILSSIPPFKLGHDIPHVTHSVLKPLVVNYPPTAAVAAVKIPIPHPPHFPVPVGHRVPGLPHPHYGLKFPHTKYLAKPDHHYHHHHHHVEPRPIIPPTPITHIAPAPPVVPTAPVIPAAPISPVPRPTIATAQPVPVPLPHALPVPAPPVPILPPNHLHLKPLLPAAAVPLARAPVLPSPILPFSQPFPYVIRPGGSVQTSVFATYPRYPLINSYQAPLFPVGPSASGIHSISQFLVPRPQFNPYNLVQHAVGQHGVIEQHTPNVVVEQTPTLVHPTQVVPQPGVHLHPSPDVLPQPGFHLHPTEETLHQTGFHLHPTQEALPQPGFHLQQSPEAQPGFHLHPTQETLPQPDFHLHPTQEPQPGFHLHTTQEPQPGFHLHPTQVGQHTVPLDHDGWSPVAPQSHDLASSHEGHYPQQGHHFTQEQGTQVFEHHTGNEHYDYQHQLQHHIQQQIEQAQYEQNLHNQHQPSQEYGVPQQLDFAQNGLEYAQHAQDFGHNLAHLGQEYGLPQQGAEGRNSDDSEQQQFHNHIPLGLQPPIDRPLDPFQ